jgi:hypothetical protein
MNTKEKRFSPNAPAPCLAKAENLFYCGPSAKAGGNE